MLNCKCDCIKNNNRIKWSFRPTVVLFMPQACRVYCVGNPRGKVFLPF